MSVETFPLAWRWTDAKHALLPAEVLASIQPLDPTAARSIHDRWIGVFDDYGEVMPDHFTQVEKRSTEGTWRGDACRRDPPLLEQVSGWLKQRESDRSLGVTVSWTHEWAVHTTWEIFTSWWDDFCYPGSDDAFVVPDDARWLLAFHHEDQFTFCHKPCG